MRKGNTPGKSYDPLRFTELFLSTYTEWKEFEQKQLPE